MSDFFGAPALALGVVPLLILVAFLINYPRARRWAQKVRDQGSVTCRSCGHVGELLVRTISATQVSSSNLRMVCAKCNSTDWRLPGSDQP
ncbi:MAG TPA: hypothetical protein VKW04_15435 [Planctomycetota bacterium]|nr:hypothetical protein [Planctomycetota bacterium]